MKRRTTLLHGIGLASAAIACAPVVLAAPDCEPVRSEVVLPGAMDETSGVSVGVADPGIWWTHNDDGSRLFAMEPSGSTIATYRVRPRMVDWEDLEAAPCAVHTSCLYLADTGDNSEVREGGHIKIVRVAEPTDVRVASEGRRELSTEVFPIRLPDGPRDIEALYVLPGERVFLITKGRNHPVTVYGYPGALRSDTVELVQIQTLNDGPPGIGLQATGASAGPRGEIVAVRTYQTLDFFRVQGDSLAPIEDGRVNLRPLREAQGEAVALGDEGLVVLTSEGGLFGGEPSMNVMRCRIG